MKSLLSLLLAILAVLTPLTAQDEASSELTEEQAAALAEYQAFLSSLNWKVDGEGELRTWSTIEIPEGYRFLNSADASRLMESWGNPPSSYEGLIATNSLDEVILFEFDKIGYVQDDEKDSLDADKLLKTLKEQQAAGNEYRRENGLEEINLIGWAVEPRYNETTNNLEWGTLLQTPGSPQFVNYSTRLLGREGVMNVTLICDITKLDGYLAEYQQVLLGHQYKANKSYAEYKEGDKLAEYGLTALIAGGALYGAGKLGLLGGIIAFGKKFFKFIIVGLVAIGVAIKKFFSRMSGREEPSAAE